MIKNIVFVLMIMLLSTVTYAQTTTVSVPVDQLTEQQKAKFSNGNTIEEASKWVGLGKEIGEAFNGAFGALTNNLDSFSKTRVGNYMMFIIAWKMIGNELLRIGIGILIWAVATILTTWSYWKTCITRSVLTKKENKIKTYEVVNDNDESIDPRRFMHVGVFIIFTVICGLIMFAG